MWHNRVENLFHIYIYIYIYSEISYSASGLKSTCLSLLLEEMERIFLTKLNGKCLEHFNHFPMKGLRIENLL